MPDSKPTTEAPPNSGAIGRKTSEFWVMIAGVGIIMFAEKFGIELEVTEAVIVGAITTLYGVGRSFVKGWSK